MRVSLCLLTVWLFLACVGRGEIVPIPSWSKSMAKEKYILTPKAPEVPQINSLWCSLGNTEKVSVRDLWHQKDLGEYKGGFWTQVPYHGVTFVKKMTLVE